MSERIPRKPGQPAKSDKHSDLYTDEDPKGTIQGLKFATTDDAEASVRKIKASDRSHAHKIQAAIAMEQRAKVMGKTSAAAVYRNFINAMKNKTEDMREEWSKKYKKSIDCNNPKGFSQKAHCQARKLRQAGKDTKSEPVNEMTKKPTARERLLSGMKKRGYDATERQNYWKAEQEKLKAEHEKLTKEIEARKVNENTSAHDEFKKAMGVGSYGDFVKRHGVAKAKNIVSSLQKERDEIRKKEWAGPQHIKHHDFAIHGLQRAIGEDAPTNAVGSGDIAGLGVGPQGEPGVNLRNKKKVMPFAIFTRKTINK